MTMGRRKIPRIIDSEKIIGTPRLVNASGEDGQLPQCGDFPRPCGSLRVRDIAGQSDTVYAGSRRGAHKGGYAQK